MQVDIKYCVSLRTVEEKGNCAFEHLILVNDDQQITALYLKQCFLRQKIKGKTQRTTNCVSPEHISND